MSDENQITPPESAGANGAARVNKATVRSGLAKRRNPVVVRVREFGSGVLRVALRDPLALFLLLASIGLALAFALLLGAIKPASAGRGVPISTVQRLAKDHFISTA
ncbi:MAG TPA: cell division protein FtsH, partial [Solirubrobacteraceae bacterium]|nr:cell division protein FtsH [Solirubrobacteraceae bacterium]